jgi:hypothetical protein
MICSSEIGPAPPVALWFKGLKQALISAPIRYVSANEVRRERQDSLFVNRREVNAAYSLLGDFLAERSQRSAYGN